MLIRVSLQRFRRCKAEFNEDDSDWAASEGEAASEEEADGTFKPQYAFWAEKATWKAKNVKGPRGRGASGATPALDRQKGRQQVTPAFSALPVIYLKYAVVADGCARLQRSLQHGCMSKGAQWESQPARKQPSAAVSCIPKALH